MILTPPRVNLVVGRVARPAIRSQVLAIAGLRDRIVKVVESVATPTKA